MTAAAYINATDVRREFSATLDNAVYSRPQFIRRTRNHAVLLGEQMLNRILSGAVIPVSFVQEEDGSYIAVNDVIEDVLGTGTDREEALRSLCSELSEYALEYYENFEAYSHAPNRAGHLPYVLRILSSGTQQEIKEMLICQAGRS